jgi:hypothetical protein
MFKTQRVALAFIAALSLLVPLANQAYAGKGDESKVEAKDKSTATDGQTARFGAIPLSAGTVVIVSESARVVVKRVPEISEIILSSNCPRNWALSGTQVRQAGFAGEPRKGTSLLADGLGSRAIVNGKVYMMPSGPMKGLSMGPSGVTIGGNPLDPLKGSDIPCNCSGEDLLEVQVPASFTGDLKIGSAGKSQLQIDSWKDGGLECMMFGETTLNAGKLESSKLSFDNRGKGSADISEVDAKVFVANVKGDGSIRVKKGKADVSNATIDGNGTIELHGSFKGLKQAVDGTGKIEVKP